MLPTIAVCLLGFHSPGTIYSAQPAAPQTSSPLLPVQVQKGIVYGTADGQKLLLDMARPKTGGPYPAVVLMHGGAWRFGSRADLSGRRLGPGGKSSPSIIETVAAHGYVAVSISYRLAPKSKFPAQLDDARTAVRFLRANAEKYDIDPDKIAAGGFSAGAHLALLLGLESPDGGDGNGGNGNGGDGNGANGNGGNGKAEPSAKVQAVVDFFGPTDLSLYAPSSGLVDAYLAPVFGKRIETDPSVYKKISPIDYVSRDDPPVLLVHGNFDVVVPIIHSERLYRKLKDAGVYAEMITVDGVGHGWGGPTGAKTTLDAIRFLDQHLKGKK